MSKDPEFKVFIDTNVWFSAFYGSKNCEKIIKAFLGKKFQAVISQQVIEEMVRNIKEKIPHLLPYVKNLLINSPLQIVPDPKIIPSEIKDLVSVEDQPIFASAMLAKADIFVTGNISDFEVKKLEKITKPKILTPQQAVNYFELE